MKLTTHREAEPREVSTRLRTIPRRHPADSRPAPDDRFGESRSAQSRVRSVLEAAGFLAPAPPHSQ